MAGLDVHVIADDALGNSSYLVEVGRGEAVSIDPRRDVDDHLELATRRGLRIVAALETHLHADFVGGARELAAGGTEIVAAADAALGFAHRGVRAGDRLSFGDATIRVIATPGHTPEHVAYLVRRGATAGVFSGGSLIVGGAARTDLTGAERTEALARAQYASLRSLASLPGETMLYPTHGGGSFCSTGPARSAVSTIGDELASNPLLAVADEDAFVEVLREGFGSYPSYFEHLREVNRRGARLLSTLPAVPVLEPAAAADVMAKGGWLIDARRVAEWARAHPVDAVSIELRDAFASWLGWVVPFGAPVVLMLEPEHLDEAVRLSRRIGYDVIAGWLTFEAWRDAALPVASVPEIDPAGAAERAADGGVFLDVRRPGEYAARHIPGAVHLELGDVVSGKNPEATEVITYCGHGERSATAASLLERRGVRVANLRGGTAAWREAGYGFEP
jgi:hydroxyacylglutathione hydrolase